MPDSYDKDLPSGTRALIFSKYYYGVVTRSLEHLELERYYSVLYFLHSNEGCSQQHICNNLAIDKTAMVKVIDHLMKKDYIDRNINPRDKREHFIVLTKKGRKQAQEIVDTFHAVDREIFAGVRAADREIFNAILQSLTDKLKTLPGDDLFFNYKKTKKKKKSAGNKSAL